MDKVQKHLWPKRRIAQRLRKAGYTVQSVPMHHGYDFVVNRRVRVALRVAFPRQRTHHITTAGQRYTYQYRSWHFNFHRHGTLDTRYADVVLCVGIEPGHSARDRIFLIPWDAISGKTFSLHDSQRAYHGRYAPYLQRWATIQEVLADCPQTLPAVA